MKSNSAGYIWLKLDKTFFNINQHILLCIAYISPESSTYTRNSNEDHLTLIQNDIMNFEKENLIMIMGDLNARTSNVTDMIDNDHDDHLPIGDHYLLDSSIPPRNNQDPVTNDRGLSLIDMCISAQLRILNGRKLGDLTGAFTCHKHNGNSSIDYCIVNENLFNEINLFEVGNHLSDISDHSKMSCHIKRIKYKNEKRHCDNLKLESVPLGYIWHNERFIEALNSNMTEREVTQFLFNSGENVNENVNGFNKIIYSIAIKEKGESQKK